MRSRRVYGTAVVLEELGNAIARRDAGVGIASQSGHRLGALTAEQNAALATTRADQPLSLPFLSTRPGERLASRQPTNRHHAARER